MKMLKWGAASLALSLIPLSAPALAQGGPTLETVKERGTLNCTGHDSSYLGFAELDDQGNWHGLDISLCRAMATAIFGDPEAARIIPVSWGERWPSLQTGEVDIVMKASGGTLSRDTEQGLQFSLAYYLGTTTIMAHADLGVSTLAEADGGTICIPAATTIERQVASYVETHDIDLEFVLIESTTELEQSYFAGRCDLYAQWGPTLAIARIAHSTVEEHVMLDDVVALEPIVAIMREGDDNWVDITNWLLSVLWTAEQEGITSENVDEFRADPPTAEISKMLGVSPGMGSVLGLEDDWGYNVIKNVGNYAEIFEQTLGGESPYNMDRGMTALWSDGGVLFPYMID